MASSQIPMATKNANMPNGNTGKRPATDNMSPLAQSMLYLDGLASEGLSGIVKMNSENEDLKKELQEKEERHRVAIDVCHEHLNSKQISYDGSLAEKQTEIERLTTSQNDLQLEVQKMGKKVQNLEAARAEKEASIKGAKEILEERNKDLRVANAQLDQLKEKAGKLQSCERQLQKLEERNTSLDKKLESALKEIDSFSQFEEKAHNDTKATIEHLAFLWNPLLEAVTSHFIVDLPEAVIKDKVEWQQEPAEEGEVNIPLYASNSNEAKFMRVAWVMNKLARLVEQYLLQPCYAFNKPQDFRWLLEAIARTDAAAESHIRRTLLKVDEHHHLLNRDARIKLVLKQLRKSTNDVFPFDNATLEFQSTLTERLHDLCDTWHRVQTLNSKIEVGFRSDVSFIRNKRLMLRPADSSASSQASNRPSEQALERNDEGPEVLPGFFTLEPEKEVQVVLGTCVPKARMDRALGELKELLSATPPRRGTMTMKNGHRRDSVHQDRGPSSRSQDFLRSGAERGAAISRS